MNLYLAIAAFVVICAIIYSSKRKAKDSIYHDVHPLRDPENKPSESIIEHYLGSDKMELFQNISMGLSQLGNPILSWRGQQNGGF